MAEFDRSKMVYPPLRERYSKVSVLESGVPAEKVPLDQYGADLIKYAETVAGEIKNAREQNAAVICAFGAHSIKNGLGRILGSLLEEGWFTHIATNGAGIIHDWEFAFLGKSSEDVRQNVKIGRFGTWDETGKYINLAIAAGAYEGSGYAESVGRIVVNDGLVIPSSDKLKEDAADPALPAWKRAAALDFLEVLNRCRIGQGYLRIEHPFKDYSIHSYVNRSSGVFTCHPMFGHDIIYTHYANSGACIGRTAEHDFLKYAESVSNLQHGVYLSVGSAVMSPMIFEKSLSMSRNVSLQKNNPIDDFRIHVVDLQKSSWDWDRGEPPMEDPAYYLRFMKTFHRMGGTADYFSADNKDFLQVLYTVLNA